MSESPADASPLSPAPAVRPKGSLKEDALNLPNLLTMLRIVMIPAVMVLLWWGTPKMNFWAGWVYTAETK